MSPRRLFAILRKEFIQMRRDRVTFAMMLGIPLIQLTLFGFAINTNPRHLPIALVAADQGPFTRSLVQAMEQSRYFEFLPRPVTEAEAARLLDHGGVQFVLTLPQQFERRLVRGERPRVTLEADASDPAATSNAVAAFLELAPRVWTRDLAGPLAHLNPTTTPADFAVLRHYNPEIVTQYNIVPGLMGVVLNMTMVMITALAITREHESGTMESLLATPVLPSEVMLGKITPYILVGLVQATLILLAARLVFDVPMEGSLLLLYATTLVFIIATLTVGITLSTIARNQSQAIQMSFFFFLPSILLSGFMFPFRGMPPWAQFLGEILPLTHYLRAIRGILLKGNGLEATSQHLWPLAAFGLAVFFLGVQRYRRTLD